MMNSGSRMTMSIVLFVLFLVMVGCEMSKKDYVGEVLKSRQSEGGTMDMSDEAKEARAQLFDSFEREKLEAKGLKVLWKQNVGQISENGSKLWHIYHSSDKFIAETFDGLVFYFDAESGVWEGTAALGSGLWESPVVEGDKMYLVTGQGFLTVDLRTGGVQQRMQVSIPVSTTPVYRDETVILGGGNGQIARFPVKDEARLWTATALGSVRSPIVISDGIVYASGFDGHVIALDLASGESLWTWKPDAPSGLSSGPALTGEKLIVGDNRGYVYSLSAQEGKLLDRYPSGAPVTQAPQVVDDMLLVFPRSSGVQCLDVGKEMNLRWSYDSATEFIGQGKQGLYFLTADKQMVCLDGETGDEKWKMQIANGLLVKSQPDKPVFYLASPAGEIVALGELD